MSLRQDADGTIVLFGSCPVDEAEPLHRMLLTARTARVDWTQCTHVHTAILQLVIAARPALTGPCGDPFIDRWLSSKSFE
jgi:hypothetical protein